MENVLYACPIWTTSFQILTRVKPQADVQNKWNSCRLFFYEAMTC